MEGTIKVKKFPCVCISYLDRSVRRLNGTNFII